MPTRLIGEFNDASVIVEVDYNDSQQLTALRVINTSADAVYVEAVQQSSGRTASRRFPAGETVEHTIGTGAAARIVQRFDAQKQRWRDVDFRVAVQAPEPAPEP
jgi:hypothetical protein